MGETHSVSVSVSGLIWEEGEGRQLSVDTLLLFHVRPTLYKRESELQIFIILSI